ncbi:hypothetical protein [Baaleninema simplex]|uniref:hypothetical protein n=1 Tax=Baaleninema simplex TaxID=2862350 RepID=UPI0003492E6A|nr:hypothetical protein [Baaleninema simplex]
MTVCVGDRVQYQASMAVRPLRRQALIAIVLTVVFTFVGWIFFVLSIDVPLALYNSLHLPRWLVLALVLSFVSWCFGD